MRKHISTLLILLMMVLPIWSVVTLCHHVQPTLGVAVMQHDVGRQAAEHYCCPQMQAQQTAQDHAADKCHCDPFQHGQFVLGVLIMPFAVPSSRFIPPTIAIQPLAERVDVLYRPPIA